MVERAALQASKPTAESWHVAAPSPEPPRVWTRREGVPVPRARGAACQCEPGVWGGLRAHPRGLQYPLIPTHNSTTPRPWLESALLGGSGKGRERCPIIPALEPPLPCSSHPSLGDSHPSLQHPPHQPPQASLCQGHMGPQHLPSPFPKALCIPTTQGRSRESRGGGEGSKCQE